MQVAGGSGANTEDVTMTSMNKQTLLDEMKADLRPTMQDEIQSGIDRAVDRTFTRLTDPIAKVEAKAVQTARPLQEVCAEVQHANEQMAGMKAAMESLTEGVAKMRAAPPTTCTE